MAIDKRHYYRALVGFPDVKMTASAKKADRMEAWEKTLRKVMPYWSTKTLVKAYPDMFTDPDRLWREHFGDKKPESPAKAALELNRIYKETGLIFHTEKPKTHKTSDKREEPAPVTGLYAYSRRNPEGYFEDFEYPLTHSYNGKPHDQCVLVHSGTGQIQDMVELSNMAWDTVYLPDVAFVYWEEPTAAGKKVNKKYNMVERDDLDVRNDKEWGDDLRDMYLKSIGPKGALAMVECVLY